MKLAFAERRVAAGSSDNDAAFDTLSLSGQICPLPILSTATGAVPTTRKFLRTRARDTTAAPAFVVHDALKRTYPCKALKRTYPCKRE